MTWSRRTLVLGVALALAGAVQHATTATAAETSGPARPSHGAPCRAPSTFTPERENEFRGASRSGSLFGLMFGERVPPRAGDEVKIVWRMTGKGPLKVSLTGPNRRPKPLTFGPTAHGMGSSYQRPGDEWGTGFRFSASGCWHIRLSRSDNAGNVWLDVRPAAA